MASNCGLDHQESLSCNFASLFPLVEKERAGVRYAVKNKKWITWVHKNIDNKMPITLLMILQAGH